MQHNRPTTTPSNIHPTPSQIFTMSPSTRNPIRRATWDPLTAYGSKVMEKWITSGSSPTPSPAPSRSTPTLVESPAPATTTDWAPLTRDEAHALIRSELYPGRALPPPGLASRPAMPRAEINRLSRKVASENTLRRTHQVIREVVVGPPTADQRILYNCRRKSYSAAASQVEPCDTTPLW
ncbi:hypothetical protein C8R46DRAFT_1255015 [Mycena filopes]|nr:hypothetical protein C8R46DRAFT_1255015 [Mycena filopes]